MTRRSISLLLPTALVAAFAVTGAGSSAPGIRDSGLGARDSAVGRVDASRAPSLQQKGRYKKQGDNCVWDAEDGGPNQCTPQIKGRFKRGANDSCTWDANDAGPDQCNPRQAK